MSQALIEELGTLLRIPSISADPAHAADVERAAQWVADFVQAAGGEAELVPYGDRPLVVGEIRASGEDANAPTVLVYGHFDVQPPDPLELWETSPFEPTVRDGWLFARGVADDKGQLYLLLKAARDLAAENALPVNVRVVCDGEEEVGGHSIVDFLAADERGADVCVIYDSSMERRDVPAFCIGTRGLAYLHVRVRTGERDLHSGLFGGAGLNAIHALMEALAGVLPQAGHLPEPLRAGIAPPSDEERSSWRELKSGEEWLEESGARPADARAAEEFYVRTVAEPSVDVHGIEGGSPQLQKTVLPILAEANLSIRLAPGQDVDVIKAELERLLRASAPEGAELEVEHWSSARAGLISADEPAVQRGLDAFERVLGTRPLLVRSGGTLPIVPALSDKGIPTILTGFALPESNIHSPNERFLVEYLPLGVDVSKELFRSLAEL